MDPAEATPKPVVVLGLLGTTLDGDRSKDRWSGWRPTVAICRQPDFVIYTGRL